ncbi:hypothetical protein HN587_00375 [Candidatus Woesearchaeota archaeon]|jgi:HTH-type transcriptional regulator, sugar sensing transcriptional regulator|nr:hypothetical protein [Candidatus Woesearchaeota archaeon]
MEQELREFGLTNNEITVYLTLLKTGITSANRVASISGMKRSTTYDTLHALITKGVVSSSTKNNVQNFEAADPKKLVYLAEEKKKRIEQIIPKLQAMQETKKEKTGVTFFEGKKGVITVLNDILDQKPKELIFIGSRKMSKIPLKHYPDNFVRRRVEQKIKVNGILANEDKPDKFITDAKAEKLSKFIYKKELDNAKSDIFIYDDKVSFITTTEDPAGIIIKNKEIAEQLKTIFNWLKKNN